jgi:hypothetical protein
LSHNVFANGREVSAVKDNTHVMGAMPDVCLSPPSPPVGPIPIPYPNFSQASDTSNGSRKVKIGGEQANLQASSDYGSCKGDEAATNSFGANVVSHMLGKKTRAQMYSFDVKFEGKDTARFMDMAMTNDL